LSIVEGFQINENSARQKSKDEIHIGLRLGGGFNYILTDYIELVIKTKMHFAGNTQYKPIFASTSKYFSLMFGLNISL